MACPRCPPTPRTCVCVCARAQSHLTLVTLSTIAHQAPLSMGFFQAKYWSGLPFAPTGDLPDPEIKPVSPALQVDSLPLSHWGSRQNLWICYVTWQEGNKVASQLTLKEGYILVYSDGPNVTTKESKGRQTGQRQRSRCDNRIRTHVSCPPSLAGGFFTTSTTREAQQNQRLG